MRLRVTFEMDRLIMPLLKFLKVLGMKADPIFLILYSLQTGRIRHFGILPQRES